ncbi:MAG: glycosyltransferase family 4 protein [Cytophagaceae bacterium]|nr:glycosyltransferase family 4 protein [Cytophagaceae bacterium]
MVKILYNSPNRGHHYKYAEQFLKRGVLKQFVSGYSRFSSFKPSEELKGKIIYADSVQLVYVLSLRLVPVLKVQRFLAYLAKCWLDFKTSFYLKDASVFIGYNGASLYTIRKGKRKGVICIVEAVNSHVLVQERILKEEYHKLGIRWNDFYSKEVKRRLQEYNEADYILVPSDFVKKSFLEQGFLSSKILVSSFGIEANSTKNIQMKEYTNPLRVLFVGTLSIRKGIHYMYGAAAILKDLPIEFVWVGPKGDYSMPDTLPLNIIYKGVLKKENLIQEYERADVFCFPTLEEGQALVVGEALSYSLPVITTENSGNTHIVQTGVNGFILPTISSDVIAHTILEIFNNKSILKKWRQNIIESTLDLSWDKNVHNLIQHLQQKVNEY